MRIIINKNYIFIYLYMNDHNGKNRNSPEPGNDTHGFGEYFIFNKNIRINASNSGGLGHNHVSDIHIFLCYDLFIKYYSFWNPVRIRSRLTPTVMWTKAAMMNQATGSKDLGRRCPRKMLSQDTIPAKAMLWEEAQGHNLIFRNHSYSVNPRWFLRVL